VTLWVAGVRRVRVLRPSSQRQCCQRGRCRVVLGDGCRVTRTGIKGGEMERNSRARLTMISSPSPCTHTHTLFTMQRALSPSSLRRHLPSDVFGMLRYRHAGIHCVDSTMFRRSSWGLSHGNTRCEHQQRHGLCWRNVQCRLPDSSLDGHCFYDAQTAAFSQACNAHTLRCKDRTGEASANTNI
jgi:hypothetical protein